MEIKKIIIALTLFITSSVTVVTAQTKFIDKAAEVSFHSRTPFENIDAVSNTGLSKLNQNTGELSFAVLIKSFLFKRALMQEHFNEDYMESETFPKSTFNGTINNISQVNFKTDGSYPVTVTGKLTIHGVTKDVTVNGTINITEGKVSAASTFEVAPQDYNIFIPAVVREKIAKVIKVQVKANFVPFQS